MRTTEEAYALIRRCEGFRAAPYRCPGGVWTIGYGHTRDVTSKTPPVTQQQADALLQDDILEIEHGVREMLQSTINEHQFSALVCFAFNVGLSSLRKSRLVRLVRDDQLLQAAEEFERWVYAGGKKQRGLMRRRAAEKAMFLKPTLV